MLAMQLWRLYAGAIILLTAYAAVKESSLAMALFAVGLSIALMREMRS